MIFSNPDMGESSEIICRPTKWFVWRAILMLVMFGGFGAYFLYDWKIGYPKKNYIVAHYAAFNAAGKDWTVDENLASPEAWEAYVAKQTIPFEDDDSMYPGGTDFEEKWPEILLKMDNHKGDDLWTEYSGEKGWPQKVSAENDAKTASQIRDQLIAAIVCFLLTAVTLFFLLRTKARLMKVDAKGFYPPGGALIPFSDMRVLDKRKWETKGIATLTYESEGQEKKAKIDGMVYGQFQEEDGAPAEALFQQVLANFEGELIELVVEEDGDEEEETVADEEVSEGDPDQNE